MSRSTTNTTNAVFCFSPSRTDRKGTTRADTLNHNKRYPDFRQDNDVNINSLFRTTPHVDDSVYGCSVFVEKDFAVLFISERKRIQSGVFKSPGCFVSPRGAFLHTFFYLTFRMDYIAMFSKHFNAGSFRHLLESIIWFVSGLKERIIIITLMHIYKPKHLSLREYSIALGMETALNSFIESIGTY